MNQREHAELVDLVDAAVRAVPGVVDLHTGTFGEVATYLPGRQVNGIRIREDSAEVHAVLEFGVPIVATADAIRAAVHPLVGTPVEVNIDDVVEL